MEELRIKEINGIKVEAYGLSNGQFSAACTILELGESESGFDSLEKTTEFAEMWINNENFEKPYREWLRKCVDKGAEIYTFSEDWQCIGEVAVFR